MFFCTNVIKKVLLHLSYRHEFDITILYGKDKNYKIFFMERKREISIFKIKLYIRIVEINEPIKVFIFIYSSRTIFFLLSLSLSGKVSDNICNIANAWIDRIFEWIDWSPKYYFFHIYVIYVFIRILLSIISWIMKHCVSVIIGILPLR